MSADAAVLSGADAWERAMRLCAGAFVDEPYVVALFGEDPSTRQRGLEAMFLRGEPWPGAQVIGAERDGTLLGCVVVCGPGTCHACARKGLGEPEPGTPEHAEWQFQQDVAAAHGAQGEHGWLAKLAVDRAVRGTGLGRHLVERARAACDGPILLECEQHRGDFYRRCGFDVADTIIDPPGADALLMRAVS